MYLRSMYESSNGDKWLLGRVSGEPAVFIRHEPNASSGGRPANFGLLEFLAQQQGPQHEALLQLLSRLIDEYLNDDDQAGG